MPTNTFKAIATIICFGVAVIFTIMAFLQDKVARLFDNFCNNTTPFTLGNVRLVKKIANNMIVLGVAELVIMGAFGASISGGISLVSILIMYAFAYVFEYGYELQKESEK
jgi:hypothetical protein